MVSAANHPMCAQAAKFEFKFYLKFILNLNLNSGWPNSANEWSVHPVTQRLLKQPNLDLIWIKKIVHSILDFNFNPGWLNSANEWSVYSVTQCLLKQSNLNLNLI